MKKSIIRFTVACSIFLGVSTATPRANAGLLFMAPAFFPGDAINVGGAMMAMVGLPMAIAGLVTVFFNPAAGATLLILDQESNLPAQSAGQVLVLRHPFLNDQPDAVFELDRSIHARFIQNQSELYQAGKLTVTVPEAEVRAALAPTNLNPEQVQAVVETLR